MVDNLCYSDLFSVSIFELVTNRDVNNLLIVVFVDVRQIQLDEKWSDLSLMQLSLVGFQCMEYLVLIHTLVPGYIAFLDTIPLALLTLDDGLLEKKLSLKYFKFTYKYLC